jgi:flagellar FliJ protein
MKRTPLEHLTERARQARDDAAGTAAGAHRAVDDARRTLELLTNYLDDHLQRGRSPAPTGIAQLRVREHFTRKLDQAIDAQERQRSELQKIAELKQHQLAERQRRLLAFETLAERREVIKRLARERREQRHTDEIAARVRRHRSSESA